MGIKIKGNKVIFTGELADTVIKRSKELGVTPQAYLNAVLEEYLKHEHFEEITKELQKGGEDVI